MLQEILPELVVVDWSPRLSWTVLASACSEPSRRVMLLARHLEPELVFQAREAGVSAVVDTQNTAEFLTEALEHVAEGECVFDSAMNESLRVSRAVRLTPREGELVALLSQGLKNKEIATCLSISEGTVKVYLSKLFQKVGAKDRFELALFGLKNLTNAEMGFDQELSPRKPPTSSRAAEAHPLRALIVRPSVVVTTPNYFGVAAGR
ncbi:MAG: response regulator transcription factor [Acidobacteria bacterium]|nr:response regulator transcription factor [Acidobacteriota bacterium]